MPTGRRSNDLVTSADLEAVSKKLAELSVLTHRLDERLQAFDRTANRLEAAVKVIPWQKNTEKIATLEKFTWAAVIGSIAAFIRSIWPGT